MSYLVVGLVIGVAADVIMFGNSIAVNQIRRLADKICRIYLGYGWKEFKQNIRIAKQQMRKNKLRYDAQKYMDACAEDYEVR